MKYKFLGFSISIILSVAVWVLHKERWFVPDPRLMNTFWPEHGYSAILMGCVIGGMLFALTYLIHHRLSGEQVFASVKSSFTAMLILSLGIISWGFLWDYIEGSEQRRIENTLEEFRDSFQNFTNHKSIEGETSDGVKEFVYNFYNSLWNVSSNPEQSDVSEISHYATPQLSAFLYSMFSLEDTSLWKPLSWGVPTLPCYGPFGSPIRYRIDSVSEIKQKSYEFFPWDPRKGGVFTKKISTLNGDNRFFEITRVISKVVIMDQVNNYNYACWRSKEITSTEILVICNKDGVMKVCGLTDTAGNWLYSNN